MPLLLNDPSLPEGYDVAPGYKTPVAPWPEEVQVDSLCVMSIMAMSLHERWLLVEQVRQAMTDYRPAPKRSVQVLKFNGNTEATFLLGAIFSLRHHVDRQHKDGILVLKLRLLRQQGANPLYRIEEDQISQQVGAGDIIEAPKARLHRRRLPLHEDIVVDPLVTNLYPALDPKELSQLATRVFHQKAEYEFAPRTGPWLGVATYANKTERRMVPAGQLSDHIYFQNGWLMLKLKNMPETVASTIAKGQPAKSLFSFSLERQGQQIDAFENLVISELIRGSTIYGPHVMVRFSRA
ncbi:hypothetical protein [Croceicoccus gelatinilyticus]|uniref:hypothetical protein n=1 Tax=Croceicoccus gelatinilyticus TaxID=2835536 RepID=UPI001BCA861F|nr:hypothetical protein [Croceicoccus gelatinilyticus]MBS7671357.1 hypothetical protein [Croceicoccus gelatinilyticus]